MNSPITIVFYNYFTKKKTAEIDKWIKRGQGIDPRMISRKLLIL